MDQYRDLRYNETQTALTRNTTANINGTLIPRLLHEEKIMEHIIEAIRARGAHQQPVWGDAKKVRRVRDVLASRPPLVRKADVLRLRSHLAMVATGGALVIQAGDCAEDPAECSRSDVWRKCAVLDHLAGTLKMVTHLPILRVGRIAGQFAKPRSQAFERVGGIDLPTFRGHLVNGPEADLASRHPDPLRILTGYMAASEIMDQLGWRQALSCSAHEPIEPRVWVSHEALLLDYEVPMLRTDGTGDTWLSSTHWPWIGERTRQVDGAHVALLADVVNPVACKVGPNANADELVALCEQLDPEHVPGRLTLIARMGAGLVADRLPPLVRAVQAAGHPVIWLSDPMHGNTITDSNGTKFRLVETIKSELREFQLAVAGAGGIAGGLHLETTPDQVAECRMEPTENGVYSSLCDPRLTITQATSVVAAWRSL
jgi:3-deoxy-7-phosphoheptulonate synthase